MVAAPQVMANQRGRPKVDKPRERTGASLNVWLDPALIAAFADSCRAARRTKKAHLEAILEEFLRREGRFPPPARPAR